MISYPKYNKKTKKYEITNGEELIALSTGWCDEMPGYGNYVLTNDIDMSEYDNFVPIGSKRERAFVGIFDGNCYSIKNIKIKHEKKYVALFKYLGNKEKPNARIRNLCIENCNIEGSQNVAAIAGVNYGVIESCLVLGKIKGDSNTGSHGVGGIAGKNKGSGRIKNCFLDVEIEGSFDVGGVAGIQEEGGFIEDCLVLGKIKANDENGMAGGIVGSFNAGNIIKNCIVLLNEIKGFRYIGEIIGQFEDETLENVYNNVVWEGTKILGNQNFSTIPGTRRVNLDELKKLSKNYHWKFGKESGIPVLTKFDYDNKNVSFKIDSTIITSIPITRVNKDFRVRANILSNTKIHKVEVCYFSNKDDTLKKVDMHKTIGNEYCCSIEILDYKVLYYYIRVNGENGVTWPYYKDNPICVKVGDYGMKKKPSEITLTVGNNESEVGVNWITDKMIDDTVLWYREKGTYDWNRVLGQSYLLKGNKLNSHKVRMTNLKNDSLYQYKVGDSSGNVSEILEFKTLGTKNISFLFVADPQAVSRKDYKAFKKCLENGLDRISPDFIVNAGDITQNGYKMAEWEACFDVLGEYFKRYLTISIAGNHEDKGDKFFTQYIGRFLMPSVNLGTGYDGTLGEFKCGNLHIVTLNTEIMDDKLILNKQLNWLKEVFLTSDKRWKVLVIHRGMYMVNHSSKKIRRYFSDVLEGIGVNLVLNGHDHIYARVTNNGITYITGGTCGNKFYEYINEENLKIDVWRDKKGCQTYSVVRADDKSLVIEVYSKENKDDWDKWILIDKVNFK